MKNNHIKPSEIFFFIMPPTSASNLTLFLEQIKRFRLKMKTRKMFPQLFVKKSCLLKKRK